MFDNVREDTRRLKETLRRPFPWYVLEGLLLDAGYQAVLLYRMAHALKRWSVPFFPALLARFNQAWTGADLAPAARIGPGLRLAHPAGVVVGAYARIGRNALLMQGVTLGAPHLGRLEEMPEVGDGVTFGAYAAAIGNVRIGDRASIGVHVLVTEDVPPGARVRLEPQLSVRVPKEGVPALPGSEEAEHAEGRRSLEAKEKAC